MLQYQSIVSYSSFVQPNVICQITAAASIKHWHYAMLYRESSFLTEIVYDIISLQVFMLATSHNVSRGMNIGTPTA